ncbi:heparan-alpha-glucosaminide N-acetyltransferase domain-containing protein [Citricoccus nitrophenolicus]
MATVGDTSRPGSQAQPGNAPRRLVGIDAARGIALIGLVAIHLLPSWNEQTGEASLSWNLFSGHSAALFALLAGVGLGLGTGGRTVHQGRRLTADRAGLAVRAGLIGLVGLAVGSVMPAEDPPAYGILVYYAVFFGLAIPFLHLGPAALSAWAAGFAVVAPVLMQQLQGILPGTVSYDPTFIDLVTEPVGVASQLLLTGTYPALPYMAYVLAGLAVGRLPLRAGYIAGGLLSLGVMMAAGAKLVSFVLLYLAGGYDRLLASYGMDEHALWAALEWGPEVLPKDTVWWLVITTPHTNTPLAIAFSLGLGLAVLGACLLIARKAQSWLSPLAAMGAMTFTLYTAHLLVLAAGVHYGEPVLWFTVHLMAAALIALAWRRFLGQGPLERAVGASTRRTRDLVMRRSEPARPQS